MRKRVRKEASDQYTVAAKKEGTIRDICLERYRGCVCSSWDGEVQ